MGVRMKRRVLLCVVIGLLLLLACGCEKDADKDKKDAKPRLSGFDFTKHSCNVLTGREELMTGTQEYDPEGRLTRFYWESDKHSAEFLFEYDALGRIILLNAEEQNYNEFFYITRLQYTYYKDTDVITRCEETYTHWTEDAKEDKGNRETDEDNKRTSFRVLENEIAFDGVIIASRYLWGEDSVVLSEYDPATRKVTSYYDVSRLRENPYNYAVSSNPTVIKGEITSESFYDENGKLLRTEYPDGERYEYSYDGGAGSLSEVRRFDSDGIVTSMARYDEQGREIYREEELPSWKNNYDELGYTNLITETDWKANSGVPGGIIRDVKVYGQKSDGTKDLVSECKYLRMPFDPGRIYETRNFQTGDYSESVWDALSYNLVFDRYDYSVSAFFEDGRYYTYEEYENAEYTMEDHQLQVIDGKSVQNLSYYYLAGLAAEKMTTEFSGGVMKRTVRESLPAPDSNAFTTTGVLEYDDYGRIKRRLLYGKQGETVLLEYKYEDRFYENAGD